MVRYLRIAILPLVAAAITPIAHGLAEDIGSKPQISTNLIAVPLIRVVDAQECRRQCDANYAACHAEVRYLISRGASSAEEVRRWSDECIDEHRACYRTC
jgi:hypothetical protein